MKESVSAQVKCRHCGAQIKKISAFPHPDKQRIYFCNNACYQANEKIKKDRKINALNEDRMVTCRCCGKKFPKSKSFSVKERYYFCSEIEYETKYKGSDAYWEEVILDYIYFDISSKQCDYSMIQRQLSYFMNKEKYKWTGMLLTLEYWHETLREEWNPDYGIGQIFPQYYEDAKKHFFNKKEIKKIVEEMDWEGDEVIIIKKPKQKIEKKKWEEL